MEWKVLYQTLAGLFDVDACLKTAGEIWETDRWCSSDKNQQTAYACAEILQQAGLSQVELLALQADGKTKYLDWCVPRAWDAAYATLCYADGEVIADYDKTPCSLVMNSPATAPEGVQAQVVVPCREDAQPEKYRGKVLLVGSPAEDWVSFAEQWGAAGILSDYIRIHPGVRDSREALCDDVMWMGMEAQSVFGFHLTPRQAAQMRSRLENGPVFVQARVSTRRYDGVCYTVSAALEGTDPTAPEVLLYGHLYEPGANDNAAGAAAILQLARLFSGAVAAGVLSRPRSTIRFAMGYECAGSMGYLAAHRDRPLLCAMAVDMVGTEKGDNACLTMRYNPMANFSFADGALYALQKIAWQCSGAFPFRRASFDILTDNILADPSLGCPAVALCASPTLSYHSSLDRPDRLEPETLRRNAVMAGTYAWGLADADADTCAFLENAIRELENDMVREVDYLRQRRLIKDAARLARHSLQRLRGEDSEAPPVFFTEPAPQYARFAEGRIPRRLVPGVLTLRSEEYCAAWNKALNLPVFWIDGKRNLWQIASLCAAETGQCTDDQLRQQLTQLAGYFDFLERKGYICWL